MQFIGKTIIEVIDIIKNVRLPVEKKERSKMIVEFESKLRKNKTIKVLRDKVKKVAVKFPIP